MIEEIIAMLKEQAADATHAEQKRRAGEVYAAMFCGIADATGKMRGPRPNAHEIAAALSTIVGQILQGCCAPDRMEEAASACIDNIRKGAGL